MRFFQYKNWEKVTGKFLGPANYDHESAWKLIKPEPCPVKIKKAMVGGDGALAGHKCYVAQGKAIKYESTFLGGKEKKREHRLHISLMHEPYKIPSIH